MSTQVFQREAIEERVSIKGDSEAAGALPRFSMCRLTAVMSTQCAKKRNKEGVSKGMEQLQGRNSESHSKQLKTERNSVRRCKTHELEKTHNIYTTKTAHNSARRKQ